MDVQDNVRCANISNESNNNNRPKAANEQQQQKNNSNNSSHIHRAAVRNDDTSVFSRYSRLLNTFHTTIVLLLPYIVSKAAARAKQLVILVVRACAHCCFFSLVSVDYPPATVHTIPHAAVSLVFSAEAPFVLSFLGSARIPCAHDVLFVFCISSG